MKGKRFICFNTIFTQDSNKYCLEYYTGTSGLFKIKNNKAFELLL